MCKAILFMLLILSMRSQSQEHAGVEQYYYSAGGSSSIVPKVYYQDKKNWFGEMRYNYEANETMSLNAGKMFSNDNALFDFSITPFAGIVLGKLNGGSVGSNLNLEYHDMYFSSEGQYTFSFSDQKENFIYNWSELGYQLNKLVYTGLALQATHPYELKNYWEPGILLGFTYKNWTFPLYAFSPANDGRNYVLGINWEWKYQEIKTAAKLY
ncbi:MAG: hypothetical protein ABIR19_03935 [Ginsengibacter sp.]